MEAEHIRDRSCEFCAQVKLPEQVLNTDFCERWITVELGYLSVLL